MYVVYNFWKEWKKKCAIFDMWRDLTLKTTKAYASTAQTTRTNSWFISTDDYFCRTAFSLSPPWTHTISYFFTYSRSFGHVLRFPKSFVWKHYEIFLFSNITKPKSNHAIINKISSNINIPYNLDEMCRTFFSWQWIVKAVYLIRIKLYFSTSNYMLTIYLQIEFWTRSLIINKSSVYD